MLGLVIIVILIIVLRLALGYALCRFMEAKRKEKRKGEEDNG